jgi:hypothetical protein
VLLPTSDALEVNRIARRRSATAGDAAPPAAPPADDGAPPREYAQLFVHGEGLQTLETPTLAIDRAGGDSNCVSVALRPRSALGCDDDDSSVAVGGADNMLRLFRGATLMGTAQCAAPPITIAWEPSVGRRLAAGCMDGSVGIYDVNGEDDINAAFTCTSTLKHHTKFVVDCQWSRDGRVLATSARVRTSVVPCLPRSSLLKDAVIGRLGGPVPGAGPGGHAALQSAHLRAAREPRVLRIRRRRDARRLGPLRAVHSIHRKTSRPASYSKRVTPRDLQRFDSDDPMILVEKNRISSRWPRRACR